MSFLKTILCYFRPKSKPDHPLASGKLLPRAWLEFLVAKAGRRPTLKVSLSGFLFVVMMTTGACSLDLVDGFALTAETTPTPRQQFMVSPTALHSGLDQTAGYRTRLLLDFAGTYRGRPTGGRIESLTRVTRRPPARHAYLNINGDGLAPGFEPGISELFQIDDRIYLKKAGDPAWSHFGHPAAAGEGLAFPDPTRLIILPQTVSSQPQSETLNERRVQRYRFTEADLTGSNYTFEKAAGALLVTLPDRYLIQYTISASLRVDLPDPQAYLFDKGTMVLHYAVTDINADLAIRPPVDLTAGQPQLTSLPRLADAEIISVFPTLLEYTSVITPLSAALFYREKLSELEWTEEEAAIFNEKGRLIFSKADQTLSVIIAPADETEKIRVSLDLQARTSGEQ